MHLGYALGYAFAARELPKAVEGTRAGDPAHWTAKSYQIALNGHYLIDPVSKLTSNGSFSVTWKATK